MTRRLPPLNALKAFEAAARLLSFTKAAEELNVTQAAVSHQVKGLEEYFGFPLFERRTRALALTEAGRRYLPDVSRAFDDIDEATAVLTPKSSNDGILTVSVSPTFLSRWLIPRMARWQRRHPDIELRVGSTLALTDFNREDVDVAVRYGLGGWPDLHSERLFEADIHPVCAPNLLVGESGKPPLKNPEDLKHHTLIHDEVNFDAWTLWVASAGIKGIDPAAGLHLNTVNDAISAAVEGLGVALVPAPMTSQEKEAGRLVSPFDVTLPIAYAFHLVYPPKYGERRKVTLFKEWVREEVSKG